MLEMETTDGKLRFEVIETELYEDDPVGQSAYDSGRETVLGVFEPSSFARAWVLVDWVDADTLEPLVRDRGETS